MRRLRSGAGEWPREQFRKYGVTYEVSDRSKSEIYLDVLPLLNSGASPCSTIPASSASCATLSALPAEAART